MQACYVNTTHPDFLSGHKVCTFTDYNKRTVVSVLQATTIVTERLNASKPAPAVDNPKSGKLAPGTINNNKDLEVDLKKEEPSFFGSFFSGAKGQTQTVKKKGLPTMESVRMNSHLYLSKFVTFPTTATGYNQTTGRVERERDDGDRSHQ